MKQILDDMKKWLPLQIELDKKLKWDEIQGMAAENEALVNGSRHLQKQLAELDELKTKETC